MDDLHHLLMTHGEPGFGVRCCLAVLWTKGNIRKNAVEQRLQMIEKEIDRELEKPFLSSGHAFVALDSVKSLNYCLSKHTTTISTTSYTWKVAKLNLVESIAHCFNNLFTSRTVRSISER